MPGKLNGQSSRPPRRAGGLCIHLRRPPRLQGRRPALWWEYRIRVKLTEVDAYSSLMVFSDHIL
jgi:hypothetical protein